MTPLFRRTPSEDAPNYYYQLGRWGEDHAARYLKKQGYRILKRNYRAAGGEIDIVASKNDALVFVEVKTQDGKGPVAPQLRVGLQKRKQLTKLAKQYITKSKERYREFRLDVIAVFRDRNHAEIQHLEGAFGDTK
jgi:putative endonuclease